MEMERTCRSKARVGALAGAAAVAALAFPAAASAQVTSGVNAQGVLTATSTAGDAIAITCVGNQVQVNGAAPSGGAADCDDVTAIDVTGDAAGNLIDLKGVNVADATVNTDYPNVTTVKIDGAGGNDTINGSDFGDELHGGAGNDRIIGDDNPANARDRFLGEAGDDTLVWNGGHDDDIMDGGEGSDTIEVNGAAAGETFTVKPSATPGRVQFDRAAPTPTPPGLFNLDIGTSERLDLNMAGGNDTLTADAGLAALGFALDVDGGPGDDTIDGGDGADLLQGGDGNDTITPDDNPPGTLDDVRGGPGDDTIIWNGGDDDDLNEGGDGTDTIRVNGSPTVGEQFTVKPSATAGRVRFDRLGANPGPFFIDIGTAERLDLKANGGNDTLTTDAGTPTTFKLDVDGGDGDDSLDGGDAADLLSGGNGNDRLVGDNNPAGTRDEMRGDAGDDTMVWNPGDGDDINEGGEGADTSEVNGGNGGEDFTVKPSPTAGRVLFDRTGPTPPGPFNVDIGTTENLVLNAAGGDDRIIGAKGLADRIKSTLNGDDGHDRIVGTDGEDSLGGGDGSDIINSRDKAEDRVDCGSGFDLAKVDKRDFLRGCNIAIGGRLRVKQVGKK